MVEVKDIRKSFGALKAVDGISFTAHDGEIFGLLGPNGAGKTTTIRIIMNILAPDEGEIQLDGKNITEEDKDRIGYLPEERGLYKKVKVEDMLLYIASLKNMRKVEAKQRIKEWLEKFQLGDWQNRKVDELSKGMAQKIQIIATLLHDPAFIFLDEPFIGLDPVSTDTLREAILELGKSGKTILFSTHNMEQAERLCQRIFIINQGKELISGRLDEVKAHFGTNTIAIEFDGDIDFLQESGLVKHLIRYPRWIEVELNDQASPNDLLELLVRKVSVKRFEVVVPSLHKIFVNQLDGAEA